MTKQTLFLSQAAHLSLKQQQLLIYLKDEKKEVQRPIEDLAILVLEHREITLTQALLAYLGSANVSVVFCDQYHLPNSILLSLDAYYIQSCRFRHQISASEPLKKQLWKRTVKHKIRQQAHLLEQMGKVGSNALFDMAKNVKSGDSTNLEAQAARHYWKTLLGPHFYRDRFGPYPNVLLNYGYAILRTAVARALAGNGLMNSLGIHHRNQYNAFCLADDIIEPYRPFVDAIVFQLQQEELPKETITRAHKAVLLSLPTLDCIWEDQRTTVGNAIKYTATSLSACFEEKNDSLLRFPFFYAP